jgi:hypothetical protein
VTLGRSLVFVALVGLGPGCTGGCPRITAGELCGSITEVSLPVVHADGWAVVDGSIDGRPARLLIDTGAGATFASASLLGVEGARWQPVSEICLGDLCITGTVVWAEDSEITPADPGPDRVHGIVGTNLLRDAIVELDRGTSIRVAFGGDPCEGEEVALTIDEHARPFAPTTVQGVALGDTLVDTGSLYSLLRADDVAAVGGIGPTEAVELCNIERCRPAELGRVTELCVDGLCEADVAIKTPGGNVVGDSFFNRSRYAIDIAGRRMTRCD